MSEQCVKLVQLEDQSEKKPPLLIKKFLFLINKSQNKKNLFAHARRSQTVSPSSLAD